jgi:hypothetical protein
VAGLPRRAAQATFRNRATDRFSLESRISGGHGGFKNRAVEGADFRESDIRYGGPESTLMRVGVPLLSASGTVCGVVSNDFPGAETRIEGLEGNVIVSNEFRGPLFLISSSCRSRNRIGLITPSNHRLTFFVTLYLDGTSFAFSTCATALLRVSKEASWSCWAAAGVLVVAAPDWRSHPVRTRSRRSRRVRGPAALI